jgi:hypothetical protein
MQEEDANHYQKRKSKDVKQIAYACIVGVPGHIAINCPNRPKHQVNQNSTMPKFNLVRPSENSLPSPIVSNNFINPTLSHSFEVLSQVEEELNK